MSSNPFSTMKDLESLLPPKPQPSHGTMYPYWLQPIELDITPKFDGSYRTFNSFWQQFKPIHEAPYIPKAKKLALLIKSTVGEVREKLDRYDVVDELYDFIVDYLKREYGDPERAVNELYRMFNAVPHRGEPGNTLETMDTLQSILTQLEVRGENLQPMYHLFGMRLPTEIFRQLLKKKYPESMAELKIAAFEQYDFTIFLRRRFGSTSDDEPEDEPSNGSADFEKCLFCGKHPGRYECRTVPDVATRKAILADAGRCFHCFSSEHMARFCNDRPTCSKCGRRHHTFLCRA
uniref:Uncharacterized protein n=1 Tax=Panagrellus redivivus TaxID=6233 RepID=A0A7E4VML9_PANRE